MINLIQITSLSTTVLVSATQTGAAGAKFGIWSLIAGAGPVVQFVILILAAASVGTWAIILWKFIQIRASSKASADFMTLFWESDNLDNVYKLSKNLTAGSVPHVFRAGYVEMAKLQRSRGTSPNSQVDQAEAGPVELAEMPSSLPEQIRISEGTENIGRALRRATSQEIGRMERYLAFLATTGSTAPFVGLFGTVWGIMNSFQEIGLKQSAGLDVVAPGISEALIATAVGLAAAIPAVVAYNYFLSRVKELASEMDNFSSDFLNIIERHFL